MKMNINEAVKLLDGHNKWRRGADIPMVDAKKLGEAIDIIVDFFRNEENGKQDN